MTDAKNPEETPTIAGKQPDMTQNSDKIALLNRPGRRDLNSDHVKSYTNIMTILITNEQNSANAVESYTKDLSPPSNNKQNFSQIDHLSNKKTMSTLLLTVTDTENPEEIPAIAGKQPDTTGNSDKIAFLNRPGRRDLNSDHVKSYTNIMTILITNEQNSAANAVESCAKDLSPPSNNKQNFSQIVHLSNKKTMNIGQRCKPPLPAPRTRLRTLEAPAASLPRLLLSREKISITKTTETTRMRDYMIRWQRNVRNHNN